MGAGGGATGGGATTDFTGIFAIAGCGFGALGVDGKNVVPTGFDAGGGVLGVDGKNAVRTGGGATTGRGAPLLEAVGMGAVASVVSV